jgi:hypothetical protein
MQDPKLNIIGIPTNSSRKSGGFAKAPAAIRSAGLIQVLNRYCKIYDEDDVTFTLPILSDRDPASGLSLHESNDKTHYHTTNAAKISHPVEAFH